jgi:hypothetical protein
MNPTEHRIARLEFDAVHMKADIAQLRAELREARRREEVHRPGLMSRWPVLPTVGLILACCLLLTEATRLVHDVIELRDGHPACSIQASERGSPFDESTVREQLPQRCCCLR